MFILLNTNKRIALKEKCLRDEMYVASIRFLKNNNKKTFKFKKDLYSLLDNYLRTSGICNPEIHLSKDLGTAKTIINNAIKDNYLILEVKKNL